jgi:hypothetical protein
MLDAVFFAWLQIRTEISTLFAESVSDAQLRTLLVNLNSALTASLASPFTQSDATTDSLIQLVDYVSKHKPAPYADAILFSNAPPMSPKTPSRTLFDGLNAPSSDNQAASDMQNIQTYAPVLFLI